MKETLERPPSRLFVITAREAPLAVILRRGPSHWFHLILWDTERDEFTPGAWFHGKLHTELCDLSPDGELFVYSAYKGNQKDRSYTYRWTAVSRPPWLYALGLWVHGGGGRFIENRKLALGYLYPIKPHPDHRPVNIEVTYGGEKPSHQSTGEIPDAYWSGYDQRGFLIYTKEGKLFRRIGEDGNSDQLLAEFNDPRPEPQPAPKWARNQV